MANNTNPVNISGPGQYAGGAAPSQYDQQAIGSGAQYQPGHQQGLGTGAPSQGNYAQDAGATTGTQKTGIKGKIENALHGNKNTPATNTTTTSQANPAAGDGLLHSSRGQLPPDVVNAQGGAHGAALASGQNVGGAGAASGAGYGAAQNQAGTETHHHHHHHHHDGNGNQQVGQGHGHAAGIGAGAGAAGLAGATAAHHHHEHNKQQQQQQQQQQAGYGAPGALPAGAGHSAVGAGGVGYGAGGAYDGGATNAQVPQQSHAGAGVTHPHAHSSHMPTKGEALVGGVGAAGLAEAAHHHHEHHGHHGHGAAGTTTGTGAHGTTTGSHLPTKGEALVGGAGVAGIGEAAHHHHEHHGHHGHGAAGTTTTGTGATGTTTGATKPSVGDKISGTIDTMVGKMTNNDQKIQEGMIKKTEGSGALPQHGNAAGTGGGYGTY